MEERNGEALDIGYRRRFGPSGESDTSTHLQPRVGVDQLHALKMQLLAVRHVEAPAVHARRTFQGCRGRRRFGIRRLGAEKTVGRM